MVVIGVAGRLNAIAEAAIRKVALLVIVVPVIIIPGTIALACVHIS